MSKQDRRFVAAGWTLATIIYTGIVWHLRHTLAHSGGVFLGWLMVFFWWSVVAWEAYTGKPRG